MAITLYTTPSCSFCRKAKDFFQKNHIRFTEYDIARDQRRADEMVRKSGQMGLRSHGHARQNGRHYL